MIGDMGTGEPPDEPRFHRAEEQLALFRTLPRAGDIVQDPADLGGGEIGVDDKTGGLPDIVSQAPGLQLLAQLRRTAALPDDGVIHRLARMFVPDQGGLPLVGDADAQHRGIRHTVDGFRRRLPLRFPDLLRVMLHPALLGVILGEGMLALTGNAARFVEQNGPGTGGSLIQRQNILSHSGLLFPFCPWCGILFINYIIERVA